MLPPQLPSQVSSRNHHQLGVHQRWILSYRRSYMWTAVCNVIWVHKFFLTWTNFTREGWKSRECQAIIKKLSFMLENPCEPKQQSIKKGKIKTSLCLCGLEHGNKHHSMLQNSKSRNWINAKCFKQLKSYNASLRHISKMERSIMNTNAYTAKK